LNHSRFHFKLLAPAGPLSGLRLRNSGSNIRWTKPSYYTVFCHGEDSKSTHQNTDRKKNRHDQHLDPTEGSLMGSRLNPLVSVFCFHSVPHCRYLLQNPYFLY
jgi:hypothetical protein